MNIPAALLTAYLVISALTTVRPPSAGSRWLDVGLMLMALVLGLTTLTFGFQVMLYWLWRVRVRRTSQGIAGLRA